MFLFGRTDDSSEKREDAQRTESLSSQNNEKFRSTISASYK